MEPITNQVNKTSLLKFTSQKKERKKKSILSDTFLQFHVLRNSFAIMCFLGVSMCGPIHFLPLHLFPMRNLNKSVCHYISLITGNIIFISYCYLYYISFLFLFFQKLQSMQLANSWEHGVTVNHFPIPQLNYNKYTKSLLSSFCCTLVEK